MSLIDILKFIFKDPAERKISKVMPIVDRINELGRLMKVRELTDEEKNEQAALRQEYIAEVRKTLRDTKNNQA